jgi:YHS domain-containing protein
MGSEQVVGDAGLGATPRKVASRFLGLMVLGLLLCAPSKNVAGQEILNTMCPVMTDEPIDETAITVIYEGKKVLLCCKLCKRKFQDHPEQ